METPDKKREPLLLFEPQPGDKDKLKPKGITLVAFLDTIRGLKIDPNVFAIRIRITHKSVPHYYTIGVRATREEWGKMYRRCPPNLSAKKSVVIDELQRATNILISLPRFDAKKFKQAWKGELGDVNDVWAAIDANIRKTDAHGEYSSAASYKSAKTNFEEYWGKKPLTFEDIDLEWLENFEAWATGRAEKKPKRIKRKSTVGVYTRNLKKLYNEAARRERALRDINPFSRENEKPYRPPASNTFHRALDKNTVASLFNYECKSDFQALCLDMFLFSYLCNGANFADVVRLQKKHIIGNSIVFERQKTKKPIRAYFSDEMRTIQQRRGNILTSPETFLFPVLDPSMDQKKRFSRNKGFTKSANVHLKKIAKELEIDDGISSIWARHTHATTLKRSGILTPFIQEQLGHSNSAITERYLSTFEDDSREEASKILVDF